MRVPASKPADLVACTIALALLAAPVATHAQEAAEDGAWRSLFNGVDLTGWKQLNGDHIYEVRDGAIVGRTVPGEPNGFLVTEDEFGDFILELEVLVDPLMNNSGIQFRSLSHDGYQNGRVHGYQAEIDTKPQRWSGSIYDEARRGWLYILEINPEAKGSFVNGRWNHYRIEAIGTSNRVWVNGVPTAHLVDEETLSGFIGLQLHANNPNDPPGSHWIRFRNIRIQTESLEPSPADDIFVVNLIPNTISDPERTQGFELLFDGSSTDGWSGAGSSGDPELAWTAIDGTLRAGGAEGADLISDKAFSSFELKFDFRTLREDATCAIHERDSGGGAAPERSTYCELASRKIDQDGWNHGVIRVRPEGLIEYWLNGYQILDYLPGPDDPDQGHIRLEHRGGDVAYRSIKIRTLD